MPSIVQEIGEKIKRALSDQNVFLTLVLVMVAVTAFGLGRESVREAGVGEATKEPVAAVVEAVEAKSLPATFYVASKNGQVYHLPHCSGAGRISEANKITFESKAEAEAAGYRPAANCKGI